MSARPNSRPIRFTQPPAVGGLCWFCDRRLYAGGRAYEMVTVYGHPRPMHRGCADKQRKNIADGVVE